MSALREAAQQMLTMLVDAQLHNYSLRHKETDMLITALRAALAQEQADPTDPGRDVEVLREHVRHLERRVRQLAQEQATPPAWLDVAHAIERKVRGDKE